MSDQAERTERPEQHLASMASLEPRFQAQGEHRHGSFRGLSRSGFHEVAYTEWGDPASSRVVICLHGLSRQGRDFDPLASVLAADGYRVLCPDLVGRGRSGWLRDPEEYALPQYCMDMAVLIARTGAEQVDWIGTSLGALVGMVLAGQPDSPIRRLIVNDIGPYLPWAALWRIGNAIRSSPRDFADLNAAEAYHRMALAPFGDLSDAEWRHLTAHGVERRADGRYHFLYDPAIVRAFRAGLLYNLSLWRYWDAIRCPVLLLRGEYSDLLLESTAEEMARRGPRAELVEIPGCGHAPALLDPDQIALITEWMAQTTDAA
jgi:pimeloyl-ACP methyl ester carboxylesterase